MHIACDTTLTSHFMLTSEGRYGVGDEEKTTQTLHKMVLKASLTRIKTIDQNGN